MRDCVCYAAECGFYLHDTGGYGNVLTGGDLYLDVCSLLLRSRGWIRADKGRGMGTTRKPLHRLGQGGGGCPKAGTLGGEKRHKQEMLRR